MGTWLGIYPTVETLGAQALAFCFVVGSYFAAEWMRKRELRKAIEAHEQSLREVESNGRPIGSDEDAVPTQADSLIRS
jgi:high-affinity iron transporter